MRFADLAVQRMLNALDESGGAGVGATHGSLHSAYSSSGANELTGGSPAYARKAATWAAASGRSKATSASMVFDVPAGQTVRWVGFWDAVSAGNFLGMVPNGGGTPEAFVVDDATADVLEAPSHGFSNNDKVVVWAVPGVALPGGLAEGTVYHVINATTDDLQLSATSGGASVAISAVGAGFLQKIVEESFGAQGTHTVSSATMSLD
jgi:hypothetical protein